MRKADRWELDTEELRCVPATTVVPRAWDNWFWSEISESAPFTWGVNDHTLVTALEFADHCERRISADSDHCDDKGRLLRKFRDWLRDVREIKVFIDLEK